MLFEFRFSCDRRHKARLWRAAVVAQLFGRGTRVRSEETRMMEAGAEPFLGGWERRLGRKDLIVATGEKSLVWSSGATAGVKMDSGEVEERDCWKPALRRLGERVGKVVVILGGGGEGVVRYYFSV